ncbi:hypothetical protein JCM33374_g1672 [Metschnikowia sp. JCM 33374]|nr:hypothetical protein JCM33374_g1672 [Metschnikowia sp. JCM 33374]
MNIYLTWLGFTLLTSTVASIPMHISKEVSKRGGLNHSPIPPTDQKPHRGKDLIRRDPGQHADDIALEEADHWLERFVQRLKSYVFEQNFDVRDFEVDIPQLMADYSQIGKLLKQTQSTDELMHKYKFVGKMLKALGDATGLLRSQYGLKGPGRKMVQNMIEINTKAWALYDSHGHLDLHDSYNGQKVSSLMSDILQLDAKFHRVTGVLSSTRRLFDHQLRRAGNILQALWPEAQGAPGHGLSAGKGVSEITHQGRDQAISIAKR